MGKKTMAGNKNYGWSGKGQFGIAGLVSGSIFLMHGGLMILLNASSPEPENWGIFPYIWISVCLILILVGLGLLLADVRRRARLRRAYESGNHVMAVITGVRTVKEDITGRKVMSYVECCYVDPATRITRVCRSRYLYGKAAETIRAWEVPVYIDPQGDGSVGFVDIDAVLPEAKR